MDDTEREPHSASIVFTKRAESKGLQVVGSVVGGSTGQVSAISERPLDRSSEMPSQLTALGGHGFALLVDRHTPLGIETASKGSDVWPAATEEKRTRANSDAARRALRSRATGPSLSPSDAPFPPEVQTWRLSPAWAREAAIPSPTPLPSYRHRTEPTYNVPRTMAAQR